MITIILILILLSAYSYYSYDIYSYWRKRKVVGPKPWPIVGNYGPVLFRLKTETELIKEIYENYPKENCVGIFIGLHPTLILRDPKMVKHVFVTDYQHFPDRIISTIFKPYTKSLILSTLNDQWKINRRKMTVLSNRTRINKVTNAIEESSRTFLEYVEKLVTKNPKQNVFRLKEKYFFVIANDAMLGKKMYNDFEEESKFQMQMRIVEYIETHESRYCVELMFPFIFRILKPILKSLADIIFNYFIKVMYSVLNTRTKLKELTTYADLILDLQKKELENPKTGEILKEIGWESDNEVVALHLVSLAIGLTVTSSSVAAFLSLALAQNPDIQDKCYEEINHIINKFNGKLSLESISQMTYLDMVVEEALRKYGSSFVINRICGSKYCFPDANLEVDRGILMFAPAEAFREDSRYYPDPDKFIPERFTPENKEKIPLGVHLPFGYGPRQCIGKTISKLILMMTMAAFLQKFKFEPCDLTPKEIKYDPSSRTRKPLHDEIWLNIIKRDR